MEEALGRTDPHIPAVRPWIDVVQGFQGLRTQQKRLAELKSAERKLVEVKEVLRTLPAQTTHRVMVPLGPLAFVPGKLIHTNEVLVLLGDNYFVERSCVQTIELLERRRKVLHASIATTEDEYKRLEAQEGDGIVEIREEYDAEKEAEQRRRRRSRQDRPPPLPSIRDEELERHWDELERREEEEEGEGEEEEEGEREREGEEEEALHEEPIMTSPERDVDTPAVRRREGGTDGRISLFKASRMKKN